MLGNKKIQITLFILVFLSSIVFMQRAFIAESLYERVSAKRLGSSLSDDLADGLHVVLCGAGSPLPDPKRSGPCVLVMAGPNMVVVDAGTGGSRNLTSMGVAQGNIDALLLTHFHSDHIDGLGELAMMRWVNTANTSPLPVIGPQGVEQVVAGFNMAYELDASYRQAHHGNGVAPLSGKGMQALEMTAPLPGSHTVVYNQDDLKITMFAVNHAPISPAVGYRFDYKGRSMVISGDTTKSEDVQRMSAGVDVIVHEALAPNLVLAMNKGAITAGNDVLAKVTHDIVDYHTSPQQAAEIAHAVNAKYLLFYHIVPALLIPGSKAAFLKGVNDVYKGDVTIGEDGTMISLPANSDKVSKKQLL